MLGGAPWQDLESHPEVRAKMSEAIFFENLMARTGKVSKQSHGSNALERWRFVGEMFHRCLRIGNVWKSIVHVWALKRYETLLVK
jgi:hypothetical protein